MEANYIERIKSGDSKNLVAPELAIAKTANQVDVTFSNLTYVVSTKSGPKTILNGIDGICKPGQVNAILGSSGAGKTTLLNILCKRMEGNKKGGQLTGSILANKKQYSSDSFARFAAYVMQDDILMETMTVKEVFEFAVSLKLKCPPLEKEERVQLMIRNLRLEKCQNTFVGGIFVKGISGGERKRTSIGYELISDPVSIFLDEPTSGLDSFTAYTIIDLLRGFAHNQGKTIIFTIHQPSSEVWALFDNIMLMVEGRFIYQGPGKSAIIEYFSKIGFKCPTKSNPGDYFMSIMHQESVTNRKNYSVYFTEYDNRLQEQITRDIAGSRDAPLPSQITQNSISLQMKCIAARQIKVLKRNPILFKARLIQSVIIALFIGAIYWQIPGNAPSTSQRDVTDKNGYIFFFSVGMMMMSLNPCILSFPSQRAVFLREENSKLYSIGPYFIAKFLIDLIPAIIFPAISAFIGYFMTGMRLDKSGPIFFFAFISILQSCCGLGLGFMGGSAFSDAKIATAVTPLLIMPFMLFAGFYKNSADLLPWIGWIQYLSPFKYSFMALAINEYSLDSGVYPHDPISALHFDLTKWQSAGYLIALFVFFVAMAYFLLATLKKRIQ